MKIEVINGYFTVKIKILNDLREIDKIKLP